MKQEYVVRRHSHFDHHRGLQSFQPIRPIRPIRPQPPPYEKHLLACSSGYLIRITRPTKKRNQALPAPKEKRRLRGPRKCVLTSSGTCRWKKACDITLWVKDSKGLLALCQPHIGDSEMHLLFLEVQFHKMWRPTHKKHLSASKFH